MVPCPHAADSSTCEVCAPTRTEHSQTHVRQGDEARSAPLADPQHRERVGRYLVLEVLGAGGMGVVYAAYDPTLDRKVAIKLLRSSPGGSKDSGGSTRLLREAQAMAQLAHPNVVPVYDVGSVDDSVFVAMELVPGVTLNRWLKAEPRGWREVLALFLAVGRGLEAAHAAGLVHRDFKPANVLVGTDGRPRVTDFGLARSTRTTTSSGEHVDPTTDATTSLPLDAPLTRAGAIMGSPGYMAPEQYEGAQTSAATDQYAFCVTLYEALYGARPFVGSDLQTLARVTREAKVPPPPSGARAPTWLFPLLAKGLCADPAQRHASMHSLLAALAHDPALARNRGLVAGAALLVATTGVLGWAWHGSREVRECRATTAARLDGTWDDEVKARLGTAFAKTGKSWAPEAWLHASGAVDRWAQAWSHGRVEACEATRVKHEQSDAQLELRLACYERRLVELETLTKTFDTATAEVASQASAAAARLSPLAMCDNLKALEERARLAPQARARLDALEHEVAEGRVLLAAGRVADARVTLTTSAEEATALGLAAWETAAWEAMAELEKTSTMLEPARGALEHAARVALAAGDEEAAIRSMAQLVSLVGWRLERPAEGLQLAELVRGLLAHHGPDRRLEAMLQEALGDVYWQQGALPDSLRQYEAALAGTLEVGGEETTDTARLRSSVGWVLSGQGKLKEARRQFERVRATREALLGEGHPALADSWNELANLASAEGDFKESVRCSRKALELQQQAFDPGSFAITRQMLNLGEQLALDGQPDEAALWLDRVEAVLQADAPPSARAQLNRSRVDVALARGERGEAVELARAALRTDEQAMGADNWFLVATLGTLLDALGAAGLNAEALPTGLRLVALQQKYGMDHAAEGVRAQLALGRALVGLGRLDEGHATLEGALKLLEQLESNGQLRAQTRLAVARALPKGDLARARTLAEQAREGFAAVGRTREATEASDWLLAHPSQ